MGGPFKLKSGNNLGGRNGRGVNFKGMGSSPVGQTEYTVSEGSGTTSSGPSGYWSGGHYSPAGKSFEKGWYTEGLNIKHMEPAQNVRMQSQKTKNVFLGNRSGKAVSTKDGNVNVRTTPYEFGTRTERISGDVKTIIMETKNPNWAEEEGMEHPWSGKSSTATYKRNPDATGLKDQWIQVLE